MSAAGNRFLIAGKIDPWSVKPLPTPPLAIPMEFQGVFHLKKKHLKERRKILKQLSVFDEGSKKWDGLVLVQTSKISGRSRVFCDFFNRDGSFADMCGNAACCIALYGKEMGGGSGHSFSFRFEKSLLRGEEKSGRLWIPMPRPKALFKKSFSFKKTLYKYTFVQVGVPHGVLKWQSSFRQEDLLPIAKKLRFKNSKNASGMNVSFYRVEGLRRLSALTYERGVENFTQACGTGALATAFVFAEQEKKNSSFKKVTVQMPGGCLQVQLRPELKLSSPAKWGW